jgi:hypothetical protein
MSPKHGGDFMGMSKKNSPAKNKASKLGFPQPMELAKLAAILRPESRPKTALETAMQFYVEAVLFCREHSSKIFEELFGEFASDETKRARTTRELEQKLKVIREDTLELDLQKRGAEADDARKFLAERGWSPKTARAVLDNFRRYSKQPLPKGALRPFDRPSAERVIAQCERVSDDGKKTYHFSKSILKSVAD